MTSALYYSLRDKIATLLDADGNPAIKYVAYYNRQPERTELHRVGDAPKIYIEFNYPEASQLAPARVQGTLTVSLHLQQHKPLAEQPEHLDLIATVMAHMMGYTDSVNGLSAMLFAGVTVDHDHTNVVEHVLDFRASYDMVLPQPVTVPVSPTIILGIDLDIDNPDIRTGDGVFPDPAEGQEEDTVI